MKKRYSYLVAYLLFMIAPASVLAYLIRDALDLKVLFLVTLIGMFIGGIFDIWAVKQNKKDRFFIWQYNSQTILGPKVFGVPIEDYLLFFVATPILVISCWEVAKKYLSSTSIPLTTIVAVVVTVTTIAYRTAHKIALKQ